MKLANYLSIDLDRYEYTVKECALRQSKYSLDVYDIMQEKLNIEWCCSSKHINGHINNIHIFNIIIQYYENTKKIIDSYGGDEKQTLKKAINILLFNPFLNDDIKQSEKYLYYIKDENESDIEYNIYEPDIDSDDE